MGFFKIFFLKIPIVEDQTKQKLFSINLKQVYDRNYFKFEFFKKTSL